MAGVKGKVGWKQGALANKSKYETDELLKMIMFVKEMVQSSVYKYVDDPNYLNDKVQRQFLAQFSEMLHTTLKKDKIEQFIGPFMYQHLMEASTMAEDLMATQIPGFLKSNPLSMSFTTVADWNTLDKIVKDTMFDLEAAIRTCHEMGINSFENEIKKIKQDIAAGYLSGANRKAVKDRLIKTFNTTGFTGFTTIDGKKLPLDFYAEVVLRTKKKQLATEVSMNRYEDGGIKHFTVTGRTPTCGHCAKYRNRVFAMDKDDEQFTYLDARETFPVHPNCQCIVNPWVIEYKTDEEIKNASKVSKQFREDLDPRTKEHKAMYKASQDALRRARAEKLLYLDSKNYAPTMTTKDIGSFRRKLHNNPQFKRDIQKEIRLVKAGKKEKIEIKKLSKNEVKERDLKDLMIPTDKGLKFRDGVTAETYNKNILNKRKYSKTWDDEYHQIFKMDLDYAQKINSDEPKDIEMLASISRYKAEQVIADYNFTVDMDVFDDMLEAEQRLFENFGAQEEFQLHNYTGQGFSRFNAYYERGIPVSPDEKIEFEAQRKKLMELMSGEYVPHDIQVMRGMNREEFKRFIDEATENDGIAEFHSFKSTTLNKNIAESFASGRRMELKVPKGTESLFLAASSNSPDEFELLLPKGMKIRILDILDPDTSAATIIAEVVKDK